MYEGDTQKRIRMAQGFNLAAQIVPKLVDEDEKIEWIGRVGRKFYVTLGEAFEEISPEAEKAKEARKAEIGELQFEPNDHLQPELEDLPEGISDFGQ